MKIFTYKLCFDECPIFLKDWSRDYHCSAVRLSKYPFCSFHLKSWVRFIGVFKYLKLMNMKNQICLPTVDRYRIKYQKWKTPNCTFFHKMKWALRSVTSLSYFGCLSKGGINCTLKKPISLSVQWCFSEALRRLFAIVVVCLNCMRIASMACFICALHLRTKSFLLTPFLTAFRGLANIQYRSIHAVLEGSILQISWKSWLFCKKHMKFYSLWPLQILMEIQYLLLAINDSAWPHHMKLLRNSEKKRKNALN